MRVTQNEQKVPSFLKGKLGGVQTWTHTHFLSKSKKEQK